jgi:hypothetical protein
MNEKRLRAIAYWRDGQLVKRFGNEGASLRLKEIGLAAALAIIPPTADELKNIDINGEPIDPDHHWWSERGRRD